MFNTIKLGTVSQTIQLNAPCTGILQRSNANSRFIRFAKNSPMEDTIFSEDPHYVVNYKKLPITVLQILIFGDNQYMVEILENKYL